LPNGERRQKERNKPVLTPRILYALTGMRQLQNFSFKLA
jgi:hypothetical protein